MAAFKRMLQVGMKAENCLLRYRALKAHLTSSSSSWKELSKKKMRSLPEYTAADIRDELERVDKIRRTEVIDDTKRVAFIERMRSKMNDFNKSEEEVAKKEMRKFLIGFAVYINGIFVVAAIAERFLKVHRPSPKKGRMDGNPVSVHMLIRQCGGAILRYVELLLCMLHRALLFMSRCF